MPWKLHEGDCAEVLKQYPDNYFETCITDPPYGMSMKDWDKEAPPIQCWEQVHRVLKPGANILVFGGTRTHHRLMCMLEDVGFDLKDMIVWLYSQGFPKALNISKSIAKRIAVQSGGKVDDWRGWYSQLKPAYEPVILGTKPLPLSENWDTLLAEIATLLFNEDVLCRKLNVNVNDAALILRSILPLFVKAAGISALELVKTNDLVKRELVRFVEKSSMRSDPKLQEVCQRIAAGSAVTAQEAAQVLPIVIGKAVDSREEMAESWSETEVNTGWSTALLWRDTLVALWDQPKTFTTEMKMSLTTDLRTLKSLIIPYISQNTIPLKKTLQNGERYPVTTVDVILRSVSAKLSLQDTISVKNDVRSCIGRLRPNYEPIIMAMKPLEGSFADNALEHKVAGLAIDKTRIPSQTPVTINTWDDGAKPFGGGAGSPYTTRQSTKGRWPANVVFDEGAARQLDQQSGITKSAATPPTHEQPAYPGQSNTGFLRGVSNSENQYSDEGGASRFFYCAKVSVKERTHNGRIDNDHPTVKPIDLLKYLSELTSTPYHSTVLDPFAGTASVGIAALETGRSYVGIELDSDYALTARKRLIDTWIRLNRNTIREKKHNTISEAMDTTLNVQDSSL